MKLIDLSHPLIHGQQTFPFDPKLSIIPHGTTKTLRYNISQISIGTHQGTHLDAMYHFIDDGKTIDQMPLDWFYGEVHLLKILKLANEEITIEDFLPYEHLLTPEAKIIFSTGWYKHFNEDNFFSDFPSLTQEAARFLVSKKIRLLGMDMPTPGKDWYELHHILLPAEIVVVESLTNLDEVPDKFVFMGFPLNLKGRDGSPIRAVGMVQ
jgi:kynurenine formamidase